MGDAIRKESSMEDILSSIRKIISSEAPKEPPASTNVDSVEASTSASQTQVAPKQRTRNVAVPQSSKVAVPQSSVAPNVTPKAKPVAPKEPVKSSSATSMSNTLDSIRAAVIGKKSNSPKIDSPKAETKPAITTAPPAPKKELSQEVTPKAAPATVNIDEQNNAQSTTNEPSLADLAAQLNGVTNSESAMDYSKPQATEAELLEAQIPAPKTDMPKADAPKAPKAVEQQIETAKPAPEVKTASASQLNFNSFAKSVEKPGQSTNAPADFVKDDVAVFAEDQIEAAVQEASIQSVITQKETKRDQQPETQLASINKDAMRGPINEAISQTVSGLVSNVVADDETATAAPVTDKPFIGKSVAEADKFKEALVSPTTKAAVTGSIDRLKQSMDDVNTAHVENVLRPMLREWLDNNLPDMVEKIVREEISRITQVPSNTK